MDFRPLRYLVAVAEFGNVTKAAKYLRISQPTLSGIIRNVENGLDVKLFNRSTSPLSLTQAGKIFINRAQHILMENECLEKELRDLKQHMTGNLFIGASLNRISYIMPRLLPVFSKRYPGIELKVLTGSSEKLKEGLRRGNADILLLSLPHGAFDGEAWIEKKTVFNDELILSAKSGTIPTSARLNEKTVIPEALDGMPFFVPIPDHDIRVFCNNFFKRWRIKPKIKMEFMDTTTCYKMSATGMGIAIIPKMIIKMAGIFSDVEFFSLGSEGESLDVQVCYRKNDYIGQPEFYFIELVKELF